MKPSALVISARVAELARELGLPDRRVTPIPGGWGSWTFDVGGTWIFRVARTAEVAAAHRREAVLLPELGRAVSFAVPDPEYAGEWDGHPFMGYRRLPGRALHAADNWSGVAGMLRELHAFPADRAGELLGCPGTVRAWYEEYAKLRATVDDRVSPRLDPDLRDRVARGYDTFLAGVGSAAFVPVLVHRDLGTEHILVDPDTRRPTGLIDFEDAGVGDPAIDFVGLLITLGAAVTRRLIDAYGSPVRWERLRFYWWMGSVRAIAHGVEVGDEGIVRDGIIGLRDRMPGS